MAQNAIRGRVLDASTSEPVAGAAVICGQAWASTDSSGRFQLSAPSNDRVNISCLGYKDLEADLHDKAEYMLQPDAIALMEVVVTAKEERGVTAVSVIGKDAINHIQPSSLKDVLELLPGGRSADPVLSSPQTVNLRSAATLNDNYATSALGTAIIVDGKPIGNNANLQSTPAASRLGDDYVNYGTDLRTVSTEDIESIEIIRGIAPVEYGDLTSGLLKIERKRGGRNTHARFKSDVNSKMIYLGRDFEWNDYTLNVGANYLNSQSDPRNTRQNYKRITGSVRIGKNWEHQLKSSLNFSLDYTGSFDDRKSDENLDFGSLGPVETYKSSYNKFDLSADYSLSSPSSTSVFRNWTTTFSATLENDLIDRWKYNTFGSEQTYNNATEPGEWDSIILPVRYESTLQVKGRPFYAYLKSSVSLKKGEQKLKAGVQWNMDKNFGEGSVFDTSLPFSISMSSRPRPYYEIPANHQLSAFAEESGKLPLGKYSLEWAAGLRASALAGAGDEYDINLKPYFDPRANLRLNFPTVVVRGHLLETGFYVGGGMHTKFPTMAMLYPNPIYGDIQEFSYWPVEKDLRRTYVLVYKINPANYHLEAARNRKLETGFDLSWNGFSLSADYFIETMTSGFRSGSKLGRQVYKQYDGSGIDKTALTGPPAVETLPYTLDTLLYSYGITTNGSETSKQGVEFTFTCPRIKPINTKVTVTGAWFKTRNVNSTPLYYVPSTMLSGNRYSYVGLYEVADGSTYTNLNTNVMLDTQIPRLGLVISTSFQTSWFDDHYPVKRSTVPVSYFGKDLVEHPYTEAEASHPVLRLLIREDNAMDYNYLIPFATYINIKASKRFYHDKLTCSLFVNRFLAIAPDYYMNGAFVRRSTTPYFGMELTVRI